MTMKNKLLNFGIFFGSMLFLVCAKSSALTAVELPNQLELLNQLKSGEYQKLDKYFKSIQEKYEQGLMTDLEVAKHYAVFSTTNIDVLYHLNMWIEKSSDSYVPYMARGFLYNSIGWTARGRKWAKDTQSDQFINMKAYFKQATNDFLAALQINKRLTVAYGRLINMSKALSGVLLGERYYFQALLVDPYSL